MKNKVQFQKGYSLSELFHDFGEEASCRDALFQWRWSDGFVCPECGGRNYCVLKSRQLYQCNSCHHQQSLTAGTIFANTKLPLTTWFLAVYLITQSKTGISALALKRELGVSYNTAWMLKQKVMQVMKETDDKLQLSNIVQVDDAYWGGESHGGKRGRGAESKTPFIAAVSLDENEHPKYMNMNVVRGFQSEEVKRWGQAHLHQAAHVFSDGLACFRAVEDIGCRHSVTVTGGGHESVKLEMFIWVNTMIGNVKNALHGVYHAFDHKHLPRYLAEFCYRFNRRFDLQNMMPEFMQDAMNTPPMPGRLLKLAESHG